MAKLIPYDGSGERERVVAMVEEQREVRPGLYIAAEGFKVRDLAVAMDPEAVNDKEALDKAIEHLRHANQWADVSEFPAGTRVVVPFLGTRAGSRASSEFGMERDVTFPVPRDPYWIDRETRKIDGPYDLFHGPGQPSGCTQEVFEIIHKGPIRMADVAQGHEVIVSIEGRLAAGIGPASVQLTSILVVYLVEKVKRRRWQLQQRVLRFVTRCPPPLGNSTRDVEQEDPKWVELTPPLEVRNKQELRRFAAITDTDAMAFANNYATTHGIPRGADELP